MYVVKIEYFFSLTHRILNFRYIPTLLRIFMQLVKGFGDLHYLFWVGVIVILS